MIPCKGRHANFELLVAWSRAGFLGLFSIVLFLCELYWVCHGALYGKIPNAPYETHACAHSQDK
eukprot:3167526-Amphidinium_carterae.1